MAMHALWRNQNLIYWDSHQARWLDAWGPGVVKIVEHFAPAPIVSADTLLGWTTTLVEAGAGGESTVTSGQELGGILLLTTDNADNDGINLQAQGEAFQLSSGKPLYFGCRVKISDATQSDLFVGLSITDTDILGGTTDSVGFRKVDASTTLSAMLEKNSSETTGTAATVVADTYLTLEFYFDGTAVHFFVDGVQLTALAQTNLPDDELLTPSIHFLTGEAAVKTCSIDWLRCIQLTN